MSESRSRKTRTKRMRKRQALQQSQPLNIWQRLKSAGTNFWVILTGAVFLIGLPLVVYAYIPKISMSNIKPLDSKQLLTTQFEISNDNWFALYDLSCDCHFADVSFENFGFSNITISRADKPIVTVNPGGKHTVSCEKIVQSDAPLVDHNRITLIVTFKTYLSSKEYTRTFNMESKRHSDGSLEWFQIGEPKT